MATESSTVAVYPDIDAAEAAVQKLGEGGFPVTRVSILARDLSSEKKVHGFVTPCDVAKSTAASGAWWGGLFGLLTGAAFLWLPGVGPLFVAGSLTSAVLGGVEGAVAGAAVAGLLGWLSSLGIEKQHILKYEEVVKAGKILLVAHGTPEEANKARSILQGTHPVELHSHAAA
jgi:hypothetical protein